MKVTGKVEVKRYRCCECGHEQQMSTNHYGEVYSRCPRCGWKHPGQSGRHACVEPLPPGWTTPEPWKVVKIAEVATIITAIEE